jgi:Mn2+/Fe2+ NRAMP family transporter
MAIAVACAATLHPAKISVNEVHDVAVSLQPLAGKFATLLFGAGLLGASLLAAAVVPLATSYSIAEGIGAPASLHLDSNHFQLFYAVFIGLTVAAVSVVSLPGLPLIPLMYTSQVVNAVLLPLHVIALLLLAGNRQVMGEHYLGNKALAFGWLFLFLIVACVLALVVCWIAEPVSVPYLPDTPSRADNP